MSLQLMILRIGVFIALWAAILVAMDPLDENMASRPTAFGKYLNTKFLNVAASHNGGRVQAGFSQGGFHINASIDGITTGMQGWAWQGRLDKASGMYTFDRDYNVSRVRLLSGVGMNDHHVTAFQLWYSNASQAMMPPSVHWYPHYYWKPVVDMQPVTLDCVVIGNRVFTNGEEEVVLRFSPVTAQSLLIKIDAADSPANNAIVVEFEVFTSDPTEVAAPSSGSLEFVDHSWVAPPPRGIAWQGVSSEGALPGGATVLLLPAPDTEVVPFRLWSDRTSPGGNKNKSSVSLAYSQAARDLGFDAGGVMRSLCNGRWFSPFHPTVSYVQPHLKTSKAATYCTKDCGSTPLAVDGSGVHVPPSDTCQALAGTEMLFVGDTRIRHLFLATVAYFKDSNLRGFLNPSHAHYHGQRNDNFWHPPGQAEACGSNMPHGFELDCAGVVSGQVSVCNGTVSLRLEETDDRSKVLNRLAQWMDVRRRCEESESCTYSQMTVVTTIPIPQIRSFSTASPVLAHIPTDNTTDFIKNVFSSMEGVWNASVSRHTWFANGRAAALHTNLVWTTLEPYALVRPKHAPYNKNISHINAEARQMLDIAGIPVLDAFKVAVERHDCHPDNVHYCSAVQNAKVGMLLTFTRQLVEKLRMEESLQRREEDIEVARRSRGNRKEEVVQLVHAETEEASKESVKRKAADEARARMKREEDAARRKRQQEAKQKMAKFKSAKRDAPKKPRPPPADVDAGTCGGPSSGEQDAGKCTGPPP